MMLPKPSKIVFWSTYYFSIYFDKYRMRLLGALWDWEERVGWWK